MVNILILHHHTWIIRVLIITLCSCGQWIQYLVFVCLSCAVCSSSGYVIPLNEEGGYKRGLGWPGTCGEYGRKAMICSVYIIFTSDIYRSFLYQMFVCKLVNTYLARVKRTCNRILRKTVSYE